MTREQRRLRLARRLAMLAQIEQRGAMRGLADALAEETRSETLKERSLVLSQSYNPQEGASLASALGERSAFASSLAKLASDAESARADAEAQAHWRMQQLSAAQTRAQRLSEHAEAARKAVVRQRERTAQHTASAPASSGLARAVQSNLRTSKHER